MQARFQPTRKAEETYWQLTIYVPQSVRKTRLIERLKALAVSQRRSVNFLVVDALIGYLAKNEQV